MLELRSATRDLLNVKGNEASADVLGSEGAEDAYGIIVVATGDVGSAGLTCAADDSDLALDSGRASDRDIDEVRIDSDGGLVVAQLVGCSAIMSVRLGVITGRSAGSNQVDMSSNEDLVEVLSSEGGVDGSGVIVVAE